MSKKEHIVIVGGGFAGLNLAKYLDKDRFEITLVDRNNFHSFPPLFYQIILYTLSLHDALPILEYVLTRATSRFHSAANCARYHPKPA